MLEDVNSLARFEDRDVEAVVEDEVKLAMSRYRPQLRPCAILLAGQPGAGKTELSSMLISEMDGNAAFINGDDYRRYHPCRRKLYQEFGVDFVKMTSSFSNMVTERLISELSSRRLNLVIEGTGRTIEVPQSTAEKLANMGYKVEMAVIAARPEISLISTLLRFYRMEEGGTIPRATAASVHDNIVAVLPGNLDVLASLSAISRLSIWNRDLQQLFNSAVDEGLPSEILTGYWNSPWTAEEIRSVYEDINRLREQEQYSKLSQGVVIDEIVCRVKNVSVERPTFDIGML